MIGGHKFQMMKKNYLTPVLFLLDLTKMNLQQWFFNMDLLVICGSQTPDRSSTLEGVARVFWLTQPYHTQHNVGNEVQTVPLTYKDTERTGPPLVERERFS